ncbi:zinc finger MYM-type protein 6-like, partial [Diabrotica undecimpunctata]|uniref:zinc finger MYM-type protein 6-like n=1 Tax=Diabrotica undecimpunctata TaxID=50387 RepID=UPI003B63BFDF
MLEPSQASQVTDAVPFSNNTVSRRIDEMGANVEDVLCNKFKSREFTVQLDESTLSDSKALLLLYVRFIDDNGEMAEEMLFVRSLITDTKGSSIFEVVKRFFEEKEIPLLNIIAYATDGAAAMTRRHRGFIAHLKQAVPGILCVHCVIHREHLLAKNLSRRLHDSLRLVIDAGKNINMAKANVVVGAFIDKLSLFEENMQRRDLTKFPNLKSSCGDSEDLQTYFLDLQILKEDLQSRFQVLTSLKVPTWFINSFSVEVSN